MHLIHLHAIPQWSSILHPLFHLILRFPRDCIWNKLSLKGKRQLCDSFTADLVWWTNKRRACSWRFCCHHKASLMNTSIILKQKKALQILTFRNFQSQYLLAVNRFLGFVKLEFADCSSVMVFSPPSCISSVLIFDGHFDGLPVQG